MKRTKSSSAGTARWDANLLAESLVEVQRFHLLVLLVLDYCLYLQEDWHLFLAFLIPEEPSRVEHIAALAECIGTKLRKRFVAISREELIQSVRSTAFIVRSKH